jgi:hypothetical protein
MKLLELRTTLPFVVAVATVATLVLPFGLNWLVASGPPPVATEWPSLAQKQTRSTFEGDAR